VSTDFLTPSGIRIRGQVAESASLAISSRINGDTAPGYKSEVYVYLRNGDADYVRIVDNIEAVITVTLFEEVQSRAVVTLGTAPVATSPDWSLIERDVRIKTLSVIEEVDRQANLRFGDFSYFRLWWMHSPLARSNPRYHAGKFVGNLGQRPMVSRDTFRPYENLYRQENGNWWPLPQGGAMPIAADDTLLPHPLTQQIGLTVATPDKKIVTTQVKTKPAKQFTCPLHKGRMAFDKDDNKWKCIVEGCKIVVLPSTEHGNGQVVVGKGKTTLRFINEKPNDYALRDDTKILMVSDDGVTLDISTLVSAIEVRRNPDNGEHEIDLTLTRILFREG